MILDSSIAEFCCIRLADSTSESDEPEESNDSSSDDGDTDDDEKLNDDEESDGLMSLLKDSTLVCTRFVSCMLVR